MPGLEEGARRHACGRCGWRWGVGGALRQLKANDTGLHKFEIAQLCNLSPGTVDEAVEIIPRHGGARVRARPMRGYRLC